MQSTFITILAYVIKIGGQLRNMNTITCISCDFVFNDFLLCRNLRMPFDFATFLWSSTLINLQMSNYVQNINESRLQSIYVIRPNEMYETRSKHTTVRMGVCLFQ